MFDQSSNKSSNDRDKFLEAARSAREERVHDRKLSQAATVIQAQFRSFVVRRSLVKRFEGDFDKLLGDENKINVIELFQIARKLIYIVRRYDPHCPQQINKTDSCNTNGGSCTKKESKSKLPETSTDPIDSTGIVNCQICQYFEKLCKHIASSLFEDNVQHSYAGLSVVKPELITAWSQQLTDIGSLAAAYLKKLMPGQQNHQSAIMVYLNILVLFTSTTSWTILKRPEHERRRVLMEAICTRAVAHLVQVGLYECFMDLLIKGLIRTKPTLKKLSLTAIVTLSVKPISGKQQQNSNQNMFHFIVNILSVPALMLHLNNLAPDTVQVLSREQILLKVINFMSNEENAQSICLRLDGNYTLSLLANLVHMAYTSLQTIMLMPDFTINFVCVLKKLLESCQNYVASKQSSLTHWHPVLGWFSQNVDSHLNESMGNVKQQLLYLWNPQMIEWMFLILFKLISNDRPSEVMLTTSNEGSKKKQQAIQQQHSSSQRKSGSNTIASNEVYQLPSVDDTGKQPAPMTSTSFSLTASTSGSNSNWVHSLMKALEKAANPLTGKSSTGGGNLNGNCWNPIYRLGSSETSVVALICSMYELALNTLTQMKHDILAGLSYKEIVLPHLWKFITRIGPNNPCRAFLDYLSLHSKSCAPEFQILTLFCECATHLITILDDIELYENQKPFTIDDLIMISHFLNNFVFKLIWHNLIDLQSISSNPLLNATHSLLILLYKRDSRRPFTPHDHWLIKDFKVSALMKDLEHNKRTAQAILQKLPHIIPHKERVILFRKYIVADKQSIAFGESCLMPSTMITINRSRIVEDGYQQLNSLPTQALKSVIRVKFINEQGLDEAGIDQDGVFKEFLEDTIKKIFDPSLNLFRVTSEQRLYPSPTSYVHENHLSLFEFVGKMLGKAVYEGIVVDVPFASFFLSQVLGQQQSALYSSIDELPSLDPELYKSLTLIKHYDEGDMSQLDLTFSVDEDCMGQIVTHELLHGGRAIPVTKETRISYIHLMAHFRMHTQIHEQTAAFIRGFRSIINPDWLGMFSTPEFQRLISGDNMPIDLEDLRRHTKYFGGFHSNHRVIYWLWDILEHDFTPDEHRLFLKFVTSCSKPPLLGFAHLEPPFSIRCVEVADDQDMGDTVGSVLRGFFTIGFRKKDPVNRLPTSSTCFNLLKLPNYQRKSTLKEKLKYAIYSNTGFELS